MLHTLDDRLYTFCDMLLKSFDMLNTMCYNNEFCLVHKYLSRVESVPYLCGAYMALLWSAYGVPMVYIRLSYGVPTEFHRVSVGRVLGKGRESVGAWSGCQLVTTD